MAFRFFIITLLFNISICFSQVQDSILGQSNLAKDTIAVQKTETNDSIIDGPSKRIDNLVVSIDSLSLIHI